MTRCETSRPGMREASPFPTPTAQFASDPMPTFWDMQPAGLWPTQPSIPLIDPEQGSGWAPSTAAPWESAASTPDYLGPASLTSWGPWDDDRYRQMLADAKRASDF